MAKTLRIEQKEGVVQMLNKCLTAYIARDGAIENLVHIIRRLSLSVRTLDVILSRPVGVSRRPQPILIEKDESRRQPMDVWVREET